MTMYFTINKTCWLFCFGFILFLRRKLVCLQFIPPSLPLPPLEIERRNKEIGSRLKYVALTQIQLRHLQIIDREWNVSGNARYRQNKATMKLKKKK